MNEQKENQKDERGIFVVGTYVLRRATAGSAYVDYLIRVDDIYDALRFNVKEGSKFDLELKDVELGTTVQLKVARPSVKYSKNGNKPYLGGFYPIEVLVEA